VRAEDGRAEEGRCPEAVLIGSVSESSRAFADVGRLGPPALLGLPDGLCGSAEEALAIVCGMVMSANSLNSGLAMLCTSFDDQTGLNS
jgi:hypothetical protein